MTRPHLLPLHRPQAGFEIRTQTGELVASAEYVGSRAPLDTDSSSWLYCIKDLELSPEGAVTWGATQRLVNLFAGNVDKDGKELELMHWSKAPALTPEGRLPGLFVVYARGPEDAAADIPLISSAAEFLRRCRDAVERWQ